MLLNFQTMMTMKKRHKGAQAEGAGEVILRKIILVIVFLEFI